MKLYGLNKLTLLDFPKKMACIVFTGHCDFRCPYCQNSGLVLTPSAEPEISEEDFFAFLNKRSGVLEGVCVSGGEPLLNSDIEIFIKKIKALGYAVKLDTNGNHPKPLIRLLEGGLVDYVAMDIKNSKEHYGYTCGIRDIDLTAVMESADYLMSHDYPYEFRTTVVREYHSEEDFVSISDWLSNARAYYIQSFVPSDSVLGKQHYAKHNFTESLHAYSKEELLHFLSIVRKNIPSAELRGL